MWLSGEQLATQVFDRPAIVDIDDHLATFFATRADAADGFYHEPGHSHSYDVFARLHLGALLHSGYNGAYREQLLQLETNGVRRNLAWQLSDGSLPNAHRSSGQTWTDGALLALFARQLAPTCPIVWTEAERTELQAAAWRAYQSMTRWIRPDGTLSPVHNTFGAHDRVGYQGYTFDGNYAALALGFLADALAVPAWQQEHAQTHNKEKAYRAPGIAIDPDRRRGVIHSATASIQINALPSPQFDYLGVNDISFAPGSRLSLCSAPGLAAHPADATRSHRYGIGVSNDLQNSANQLAHVVHEFQQHDDHTLSLRFQVHGSDLIIRKTYQIIDDVVSITLASEGSVGFRQLYIPCPCDLGYLPVTIAPQADGIHLHTDSESLHITLDQQPASIDLLPLGMTSRRARCSLALLIFPHELTSVQLRLRHRFHTPSDAVNS